MTDDTISTQLTTQLTTGSGVDMVSLDEHCFAIP